MRALRTDWLWTPSLPTRVAGNSSARSQGETVVTTGRQDLIAKTSVNRLRFDGANTEVLAYSAARTASEWVVMVGTEPRATYKDANGVTFSPSGVLAYQATDESGHFVMVGDERQASFNAVTDPTFRVDGTVVYSATERGQHYLVVGSEKREVPKPVEGGAVSADGTRVIWWYREDERRRMVINGARGPKFIRRVARPILHAEAGTFVYTAESDDGFYVVTPRGMSPKYQGVLWNP